MATILEALQNAEMNTKTIIDTGIVAIAPLAQSQWHNAIKLLEKGYDLDTEVEPLLKKYSTVEHVPEV